MWPRLAVPLTCFVCSLFGLLIVAVVQPVTMASTVAQQPRNVTVLVGAGRDTDEILTFFPQTIRIRAGDTITWQPNSDALHTVSFPTGSFAGPGQTNIFLAPDQLIPVAPIPIAGRPGVTEQNPLTYLPWRSPEVSGDTYSGAGFVSSGRFIGLPVFPGVAEIESFSLTFDRPGTYRYLCLIHTDQMAGTVEVVGATVAAVPSQAEIDAQAQAETDTLMALLERGRALGAQARSEPGPNNTTVWYVRAGNSQFQIQDVRVQVLEFLPKDVTVSAGDTVVWVSPFFHSVTFIPAPPPAEPFIAGTGPDGSAIVVRNPEVFSPAKPSAVFDPRQYFNSSILSIVTPQGDAWALTFDTPGTFEYFCSIHREQGMVGTLIVVPR